MNSAFKSRMKRELSRKLHLGCGNHIIPGFVNVDRARLPGVDVVHDLSKFPWPFRDGGADEIVMVDVLEHLPSVTATLDEIFRVTTPGGRVVIRVPYYNSWDASFDPTHMHLFNENSFDFFDSSTEVGKERAYYSHAAFRVLCVAYLISPFKRTYVLCRSTTDSSTLSVPSCYAHPVLRSSFAHSVTTHLAHKLGNVIRTIHVELVRL